MFTLLFALGGCQTGSDDAPNPPAPTTAEACVLPAGADVDFLQAVGCEADFLAIAARPLDASIPGALAAKTLIDRVQGDALYLIDSVTYPIHYDFASAQLSGDGLPFVPDLGTFNATEYYSPDRRFLLGAVAYYDGPAAWVYEISPYDTSSAEMVATAFRKIRDASYFGPALRFHPTSEAVEAIVADLPADVPVITTDELFAGVDYQPLNLGTTTGLLTFRTASEVDGAYLNYRELVVLDAIPNDIGITAGIITAEFQTPLAHINVLSVNRGTPNMGLSGAWTHPDLRALEGKWVSLTVDPFAWTIAEISEAEAAAWWEENKPDPLQVPAMDLSVQTVVDLDAMIDPAGDLADQIDANVSVFGTKATNYAAMRDIGDAVPIQPGFAIPFSFYDRFMTQNGLWDLMLSLEARPDWGVPTTRAALLEAFMESVEAGVIDPADLAQVEAEVAARWPGHETRFRSSTNSEDLGTFTGAGLYQSHTGRPVITDPASSESLAGAIRATWATIWSPRAWEEREYWSIDHHQVGMGLLVTENFGEEEANGVAVTNNVYDLSGFEPAFYVNVQIDDNEVVQPALGVIADAYLHYFSTPGSPVVYIQHSNLIPAGETVLSAVEVNTLGVALDAIHAYFQPVYGATGGWYGMDVEFKFDDKDTPGTPQLFIKQARPYPGWQ